MGVRMRHEGPSGFASSVAGEAPRVIILGATSSIARAAANHYASEGASILLAGRREEVLHSIAGELEAHGAGAVEIALVDFIDEQHPLERFSEFVRRLGWADHVLIAFGMLGDQGAAETDSALAARILSTNFTSAAVWIVAAAGYLQQRGTGSLVVLGSLSGDRIRGKMLLYGAAKAGLAALMQGITDRLEPCGARAILVKPGPTETPMTRNLKTPRLLRATPRSIGAIVHKAAAQRRSVVYAPGYWRWIMFAVRMLPGRVFRRAFS
jgi:short-subunit dehydrogenase